MKFKLMDTIKTHRGSQMERELTSTTYVLASESGNYELVRQHSTKQPSLCRIFIRWRVKKKDNRLLDAWPQFRVVDMQELTSIMLLRELLSMLRFVPESIPVGDLRKMMLNMAEHYGNVTGPKKRRRCEVSIQMLHKRSLFHMSGEVRKLIREAGMEHELKNDTTR